MGLKQVVNVTQKSIICLLGCVVGIARVGELQNTKRASYNIN